MHEPTSGVSDGAAALFNRPRAMQVLSDQRRDGLIASSAENVTYLTGFEAPSPYMRREVQVFAVATADGQSWPSLVMPASFLAYLVDQPWHGGAVHVYGHPLVTPPTDGTMDARDSRIAELLRTVPRHNSAVDAVIAALTELDLLDGTLALDETGVTPQTWSLLRERLDKADVAAGSAILRRIRMVKTEREMALLRRSSEIIEAAELDMLAAARVGTTEQELEGIIERRVMAEGATVGYSYLGVGSRGALLRPASGSAARAGDLIRTEMGCTFHHYWSDTGRTAVLGSPSDRQRRLHAALLAGHRAALEALRAGTPASTVFDAAVRAVRAAGFSTYERPHVGHGIGLQLYDVPTLSPTDRTVLEAGMVINVEIPYYELGFGSMQIEDTLLVTDKEPVLLSNVPWDLRVL